MEESVLYPSPYYRIKLQVAFLLGPATIPALFGHEGFVSRSALTRQSNNEVTGKGHKVLVKMNGCVRLGIDQVKGIRRHGARVVCDGRQLSFSGKPFYRKIPNPHYSPEFFTETLSYNNYDSNEPQISLHTILILRQNIDKKHKLCYYVLVYIIK